MMARVVERTRALLDERVRIARTLHDTFLQSVMRFLQYQVGLPKGDKGKRPAVPSMNS